MSSDETYYWVWGRHLELSYYDHPPFVAWLYWLGQGFEWLGLPARWPGVIVGHLALWIWVLIGKKITDIENIRWWLWLVILNPMIGLGSVIVTPDIPLMFFWSLSLYLFVVAFERPGFLPISALGAAIGLGFASKYSMVLFAPLAILWLMWKKKWNVLSVRNLACSIFFFFAASAPVWLWNLQNDWVSFKFQLNHGLGGGSWDPQWTLMYVGGQLLFLFPTTLYLALRARLSPVQSWMRVFAFGPLIFFFFTSFKGHVEANWAILSYPAVFLLAATVSDKRIWLKATLWFWGAIAILATSQVLFEWIPLPDDAKTTEHRQFETFIPYAKTHKPFFARNFQMASQLSYQLKEPIYKLKGMSRKDFYDFRPESVPTGNEFYLVTKSAKSFPKWVEEKGYSVVEEIPIDDLYVLLKFEKGRP